MRIQTWNLVYLIGLIVYIAIRGRFGARTKRNEKVVSRVDTSDRALVVIGDLLLDVTSKPARPSNADLKQLVTSLDKIADHTPFPSIGEHLPEQGLGFFGLAGVGIGMGQQSRGVMKIVGWIGGRHAFEIR